MGNTFSGTLQSTEFSGDKKEFTNLEIKKDAEAFKNEILKSQDIDGKLEALVEASKKIIKKEGSDGSSVEKNTLDKSDLESRLKELIVAMLDKDGEISKYGELSSRVVGDKSYLVYGYTDATNVGKEFALATSEYQKILGDEEGLFEKYEKRLNKKIDDKEKELGTDNNKIEDINLEYTIDSSSKQKTGEQKKEEKAPEENGEPSFFSNLWDTINPFSDPAKKATSGALIASSFIPMENLVNGFVDGIASISGRKNEKVSQIKAGVQYAMLSLKNMLAGFIPGQMDKDGIEKELNTFKQSHLTIAEKGFRGALGTFFGMDGKEKDEKVNKKTEDVEGNTVSVDSDGENIENSNNTPETPDAVMPREESRGLTEDEKNQITGMITGYDKKVSERSYVNNAPNNLLNEFPQFSGYDPAVVSDMIANIDNKDNDRVIGIPRDWLKINGEKIDVNGFVDEAGKVLKKGYAFQEKLQKPIITGIMKYFKEAEITSTADLLPCVFSVYKKPELLKTRGITLDLISFDKKPA